ncbi:biotin--[acetyl-CoA-carboxylase] ligase [Polymorphobacter multimanifer]|nr:biotin--[acetyl-CoA-carboxylase] ligase [Polymorphobacter multimanifer]
MAEPVHTHLAEVGSTNDWLLAHAADLPDGWWVRADRQTAGRGRRGRVWHDGAGNLMASVLVKAEGPVQQFSFVAAVALRGAIAAACGVETRLKWPNDLLFDGAKVSGILLERAGDALVVGIGVNVGWAPDDLERPAVAVGGSVEVLFAALARHFALWRGRWAMEGFAPVRAAWLAAAQGIGGRIEVRLGHETLTGIFEGLGDDGALLLRMGDGRVRPVHAGEVFALGGRDAAGD